MADNIKLETRFKQLAEPEKEMKQFIDDVDWYGWPEACEMWKDKIGEIKIAALQGFLKRMDLQEDFGKVPKLNTPSYKNQANILIEEFLSTIFKYKTRIEQLEQKNKELEMKNRYLEYQHKAQFKDESLELREAIEKIKDSERD